jgi:hypothetical protein
LKTHVASFAPHAAGRAAKIAAHQCGRQAEDGTYIAAAQDAVSGRITRQPPQQVEAEGGAIQDIINKSLTA